MPLAEVRTHEAAHTALPAIALEAVAERVLGGVDGIGDVLNLDSDRLRFGLRLWFWFGFGWIGQDGAFFV
jgi:hypothetical protein